MRFEFHIVLDLNDFKWWIIKKWYRYIGKPQYTGEGRLWGYKYKDNTWAVNNWYSK